MKMSFQSLKAKSNYFVHRKVDYVAYRTEEEVHSALIEVLVFAVFLVVTTALALHCRSGNDFYSNNSFQRLLIQSSSQEKLIWEVHRITSIENWWYFVEKHYLHRFMDNLKFPNILNTDMIDPIGLHKKPRLWGAYTLLYSPRLYQIRVKPKKCKNPGFIKINRTCYGSYSALDQSNEPYYKGTKYMDIHKSDIGPMWATTKYFNGGGYFVSIPPHKTEMILESLRNKNWIDGGTRLVVLTFETYNFNLGTFNSVKLITEVLPTGNIVVSFESTVVPLESVWSVNNPGIVFAACVFYIIVIFNTGNEIYEMYLFGIKTYLQIIWNYFDWGVIITAYISLGFSIAHTFYIKKYLDDIENGNKLASLDRVAFYDTIYLGAISLCTLQLWIRIFRFINFNATMTNFNTALRRCAPEILGFTLILIIIFTIFGFFGLLKFGTKHCDFATFTDSFLFMFRLMLHDFDYKIFKYVDPFWGPIYLTFYILIVLCILVNMFLAIISLNYMVVKDDAVDRPGAIKTVFFTFINKINHLLKLLQNKLWRKSKPSIVLSERSQKKVQFAKKPGSSQSETDSEESSPKENTENEEPMGRIRFKSLTSLTSLAVSFKSDEYEDDEEAKERAQQMAQELLSGLDKRLDFLEAGFKKLGNDINYLVAKFEEKQRKMLTASKSN